MHIGNIGAQTITRGHEHFLKGKNIWNICEYDDNKLVCTRWDMPHLYLFDRSDPQSLKKQVEIKDLNSGNKNITDLVPLPAYDPVEFPFFIKRGAKQVSLIQSWSFAPILTSSRLALHLAPCNAPPNPHLHFL